MNIYPPGARIAGIYEVAGRPLMGGMGIVYLCHDLEEKQRIPFGGLKQGWSDGLMVTGQVVSWLSDHLTI